MIYRAPSLAEPIDQGDIVESCPIPWIAAIDLKDFHAVETVTSPERIVVLTQTCDLVQQKASYATVAVVRDAQRLIDDKVLRAADVKGPIRSGRVYGWYFLPKSVECGLPEMIVDLRQLYTARLDLLVQLCSLGHRRARVQPLYREHLAKHFADSYSRIGLPEPYPTD